MAKIKMEFGKVDGETVAKLRGAAAAYESGIPHAPKGGWPEPRLYTSPIDLPAARSGKVAVEHGILEGKVPIIGHRQSILRGRKAAFTVFERARIYYKLVDDDHGVWMTDMPEELNQIGEALELFRPEGSVLVGGLGLGILAATLQTREEVTKVTVVERSPDVIKLCTSKSKGRLYSVQECDIAKYLCLHVKPFDCYMLDTWQGTNEGTWWGEVMPLRRIIRNMWGMTPRVHCWAEDIMLPQVVRSLQPPHRFNWLNPKIKAMTRRQALWFVRNVGTKLWEQRYGSLIAVKGER